MSHINQKRWVSIGGLGVVVATSIAAAAMTGSCVFGSRTNLCERFGVRCKEGQECAAQQMACIDIGGCGNGIIDRDKGEICDDGNIVDGEIVNGVFVPDSCSHDCMSDQTCGNGQTDTQTGEQCDDGERNGLPDDGCDNICHLKAKFCGNGIVDINKVDATMSEQCDPGNTDSAGCNSNQANNSDFLFNPEPDKPLDPVFKAGCKFSRCGDGYTNAAAGEKCDSRGQITISCNGPLCTLPTCGDNFHNTAAGEDCDNGSNDTVGCNGNKNGNHGPGSCKFPKCGDGYANTAFIPPRSKNAEACDTMVDSDTCNGSGNGSSDNPDAQCQPARCGDGYVNGEFTPKDATAVENCDNDGGIDTMECNGNNKGKNGPGSCRKSSCGDGYKNTVAGEGCDGGKDDTAMCNGSTAGPVACQEPSCGDGYANSAFTPKDATAVENCDNDGGIDTMECNGNNKGRNGPGSCRKSSCGDGYKNTVAGEGCDEGNGDTAMCNGSTAGSAACQKPSCGDGYVNPKFIPPGADRPEECEETTHPCAGTKICSHCNCN